MATKPVLLVAKEKIIVVLVTVSITISSSDNIIKVIIKPKCRVASKYSIGSSKIALCQFILTGLINISLKCSCTTTGTLLEGCWSEQLSRVRCYKKLENTVQCKSSIIFTKFIKMCFERA